MSTLLDRIRNEPALISGLVLAVAALFGLDAKDIDVATIEGLVVFVVPLLASVVVRQRVTPVR